MIIINLLKKLPIEIVREHIIPYTYNCQDVELCNDIKSFNETKIYLLYLYFQKYYFIQDDNLWLEWLDNDILRFINTEIPTTDGSYKFFIPLYRRLPLINDKSDKFIRDYVYNHMRNFENMRHIQTNIGLLNEYEREQLIFFVHKEFFQIED
jgi:hypothetical protein